MLVQHKTLGHTIVNALPMDLCNTQYLHLGIALKLERNVCKNHFRFGRGPIETKCRVCLPS